MSIINNKKVYHDYEIIDKIQAGIQLFGYEVKSIRTGKANITGSKVIVRGGEAFVVGMRIDPYQVNNIKSIKNFDTERTIKVLLKKSEIKKLYELEEKKQTFTIPLSIYLKNNLIKMELAICKKLKKHDKKQKIKERDLDREIRSEY